MSKTQGPEIEAPPSVFNEYRDWFVLLGAASTVARTITLGILGFIHGDLPHNTGDDLYYFYNTADEASKEIAGQSYGGIAAGVAAGKSYWLARIIQRLKELGKNRSSYQSATTMGEESQTKENSEIKIAECIKKYFREEFERLKERLSDENGLEHAATLVGVLTGIAIAAAMCKISLVDTLKDVPIPMVNEACVVLGIFLTVIGNIGTFGGAFGRAMRAPGRLKNNLQAKCGTLDRTYEILIVAALITTVVLLIVYNLHCPLNFFTLLHMVELVGSAMGGAGYIGQGADFALDLDGYKGKRRSLTTLFTKPWKLKNLEWNHQNRATIVGLGLAGALAPVLLTLLPKIVLALVLTRFLPPVISEIIFVLAVINIVVGASRRIGRVVDGYYGNLAKVKQQQSVETLESEKDSEEEKGIIVAAFRQPNSTPSGSTTERTPLLQSSTKNNVTPNSDLITPFTASIQTNRHTFFTEPNKAEKISFGKIYQQIDVKSLPNATRKEIIDDREKDTREIRREETQRVYTESLCKNTTMFRLPTAQPACGEKIEVQKFAVPVLVATL